MTDHAILFSGPMVRALIEGRKTETRRLAASRIAGRVRTGDRLWVRERFVLEVQHDALPPSYMKRLSFRRMPVWYAADGETPDQSVWGSPFGRGRASIHMPKWASRITLTVSEVERQRLRDIDAAGALAEGIVERRENGATRYGLPEQRFWQCHETPTEAWLRLFDRIHRVRDGEVMNFHAPVAVIRFSVSERNILELPQPQRSAA